MRIVVNGEAMETEAPSLAALLESLAFAPAIVATAVNGAFVPRGERDGVALAEGDAVEVISPRQGG